MIRKKILLLLLTGWFVLSIFSVIYNMVFIHSEITNWYFLTDSQKRYKIFGDLYTFVTFIDQHTPPETTVLIVAENGFPYLLARYYIYPKKVVFLPKNEYISESKQLSYDYVASYSFPLDLSQYGLVSSFTDKNTSKSGYLYKKR